MKWVLKTSSVRVATSDDDRTYRSIQDTPPELREKIRRAIESPEAETILIANQEAYDQIVEKTRELPPELRNIGKGSRKEPAESDYGLTNSARRVLFTMFGSIGALWLIWAWLIQIGK